ncbi:MAG: DnaJ domain-containing protein [Armatimonadota bacterium]|nr:MAG: DnaJ domain-containing protein [Armatimonadota bacterium]
MAKARTAYDVLGLPYDAPPSQVRSRYRQLTRRFEPDLEPEQIFEHEDFLRIAKAYLVLDSPRRSDYTKLVRTARGAPVETPDLYTRLSTESKLLLAAEAGVARRQYKAAARLAKDVLEQNQRNAKAYALLGDILRIQSKYGEAISMYNYAIQMDPDHRRYWQLLEESTALREGRRVRRSLEDEPGRWHRPVQVWLMIGVAALFIEASILLLRASRGPALFFGLPAEMLAIAALDGMLAGLALAATDILTPYDDEMISYSVLSYWAQAAPVPVFAFVLLPGLVFFWVAIPLYAITAYLDEYASIAICMALTITAMLTLGFCFVYPELWLPFFIFGGNFIWAGFNAGWAIGSMRSSPWQAEE